MSVELLYVLMLAPFAAFCLVLTRLLRPRRLAPNNVPETLALLGELKDLDRAQVEAVLADGLASFGMRAQVIGPDGSQRRLLRSDEVTAAPLLEPDKEEERSPAAIEMEIDEEAVAPGTVLRMRTKVLAVVASAGRPMAAEEIADALGGISHHTVTPRLSELEKAGLIARTDERHTNRSGKRAVRFAIKEV